MFKSSEQSIQLIVIHKEKKKKKIYPTKYFTNVLYWLMQLKPNWNYETKKYLFTQKKNILISSHKLQAFVSLSIFMLYNFLCTTFIERKYKKLIEITIPAKTSRQKWNPKLNVESYQLYLALLWLPKEKDRFIGRGEKNVTSSYWVRLSRSSSCFVYQIFKLFINIFF